MWSYLFGRRVIVVCCFLLLSLAACGPEAEPVVTATVVVSAATATEAVPTATPTSQPADSSSEDLEPASGQVQPTSTPTSLPPSPTATVAATATPTGMPGPDVLIGHQDGLLSVAFSPDGQTLASSAADGTIRLWRPDDPAAEPTVLRGHENWVWSVAFSPDGHTLASGSLDQSVRLWRLDDATAEPTILTGHGAGVNSVAFSPDGQTLASASGDGTIRLWRLDEPTAKPTVLIGHGSDPIQGNQVFTVDFSPDGQTLASGVYGTVRLWRLADLAAVPPALTGEAENSLSVDFSPDGQTLASGSLDGTIRLYRLDEPAAAPVILDSYGHRVWVRSVVFSPDGQTLATAGDNGIIRLYRLDEPAAAPIVLRGHQGWVNSVAFTPDGQMLASAGEDRTIRLWRLSTGGSPRTATAVATARPSPADQRCEQPFADVVTATENVIEEGLQQMEDSETGTLAWPPQAWEGIADQMVAAGALFLDACTDLDSPLAEQPERLTRLAELSRVIPQMEFTFPVEFVDDGLWEMKLQQVYTPTTQLLDIDKDGSDELILHTQLAYFSEETLYGVLGGLSIAYVRGPDGWQGHVIWPVPHYVDRQPGSYPAFAGPQLPMWFEGQDYFEAQAGEQAGKMWHYYPVPDVQVIDAPDSPNGPYLAVSGALYGPPSDVSEMTILRWSEQEPEVAMRLAWLGWCGAPPWEIGEDGRIYLLATPDFPEHGCSAVQGRVFTLGESDTFTACTNDSVFVGDVTVPDGTHLAPGTAFTKTWRLWNSGSCGWGAWYGLNFVSGERMDGPESMEIGETVLPGEEVDISVALTAPEAGGTYRGQWQMVAPDGTAFGARPYVEIVVP